MPLAWSPCLHNYSFVTAHIFYIFCIFLAFFATLTLELCYGQTGDPEIPQMVLDKADMCWLPPNFAQKLIQLHKNAANEKRKPKFFRNSKIKMFFQFLLFKCSQHKTRWLARYCNVTLFPSSPIPPSLGADPREIITYRRHQDRIVWSPSTKEAWAFKNTGIQVRNCVHFGFVS